MREILFRGKRLDHGVWEEGYYSPMDLPSYDAEPVDVPCIIRKKDLLWCKVDPATVGQYTGRTDKNGKKIFEGDIIKAEWGYQGEVEFDSFIYAMMESTIDDNVEVIGNIHDNPELLDKEAEHETGTN